jgi:hypothetical protein
MIFPGEPFLKTFCEIRLNRMFDVSDAKVLKMTPGIRRQDGNDCKGEAWV